MKHPPRPRSLISFLILALLLSLVTPANAAPPEAPTPLSPAEGATIATPTFSWTASSGAAKYELEVGPQSDPNTVYWSAQTVQLTLTPNDANKFPNEPLYWRVRAKDEADLAGAWSSKVNFTKAIPAPVPVSPADGSSGVGVPAFEWQSVPSAAYYKLELSDSPTFLVMEATYTTYNTRFTPVDALPHGVHYWRVSGVDPDDHVGTASPAWSFTKNIPAPALVNPYDGHPGVVTPTFEWLAVPEAAYYKVEVSASATFVPVDAAYTTYNTITTPVNALAHGTFYWRVSGVDAGDHVGAPGTARSFTKGTDGPVLISPEVNAIVAIPTMEWAAVGGAAYYKVELSKASNFNPVEATYNTYNLRLTPEDALELDEWYWRVSGVDAEGHVGGNNWRRFTLQAPAAAIDPTPLLLTPVDTETISTDPTFSWTRVVGADHYRLVVSEDPDFSPTYSTVVTDYSSYTPAVATSPDAYPNGVYYWEIEARNSSGTVIATSLARSFTKQEALPLISPPDGASGLTADPTFEWGRIVGADHYRLVVSEDPDFNPTYNTVVTDYTSYTPTIANSPDAYPNGTYYWKVEGRTSSGTVIAASEARSLTKQEPLPLIAPDEAAGLTVDPTFQWSEIVGADHYRLVVSEQPDFSPTYNTVVTDYNSYTPAIATSPDAYPNGAYYWKIEARTSGGTVIAASLARSLTKQEPLPLIAPTDGAKLPSTPTFEWSPIVGADHYRLVVSAKADFSTTYESVVTDYPRYTPYSPVGKASYANGKYYWKIEGRTSGGTVIATSSVWTVSVGEVQRYLPIVRK
jgi:hypothetical protein